MQCRRAEAGERFSHDGTQWFATLEAAVDAMPAATPRERYDRAVLAAYAASPEWAAAQRLPTLRGARAAADLAERKRVMACQAAAQRYLDEISATSAAGQLSAARAAAGGPVPAA